MKHRLLAGSLHILCALSAHLGMTEMALGRWCRVLFLLDGGPISPVVMVRLQFLAGGVLCLFDGGPVLGDFDLVHQLHGVCSYLQGGPLLMELQLGLAKGSCLLKKSSPQVDIVRKKPI